LVSRLRNVLLFEVLGGGCASASATQIHVTT
jgi:hypothetical protein